MAKPAALQRVGTKYPLTVARELAALETELGGRAQLVGMLALAPLTPDLRYVLGLLGTPTNAAKSLAEICAQGNILPGELIKQIGQAALQRGKALALQAVGAGIAAVATDVMRRAAPYEEPCGTCMVDGVATGRVTPEPTTRVSNPQPEPCPQCKGSLRLLYMPDLARQQLAVDMAQLLPKSGGINILNQQNNANGAAGGVGMVERLQQMADQALYGSGLPLDADLVEEDLPPPEPAAPAAGDV